MQWSVKQKIIYINNYKIHMDGRNSCINSLTAPYTDGMHVTAQKDRSLKFSMKLHTRKPQSSAKQHNTQ